MLVSLMAVLAVTLFSLCSHVANLRNRLLKSSTTKQSSIHPSLAKLLTKSHRVQQGFIKVMEEMSPETRVVLTKAKLETLQVALELYYRERGRYPSTKQGVQILLTLNPLSFPGTTCYVSRETLWDEWGNPIQYRYCPGRTPPYVVFSYGADGQPGGKGLAADIYPNWPPKEAGYRVRDQNRLVGK